jgi:hypothetical protein
MPFVDTDGNPITYEHGQFTCAELLPQGFALTEGEEFTCLCGRLYTGRRVWPGAAVTWYHSSTPLWIAPATEEDA